MKKGELIKQINNLTADNEMLLKALKTLLKEEKRDDDDVILDAARIQAKIAIDKAEAK